MGIKTKITFDFKELNKLKDKLKRIRATPTRTASRRIANATISEMKDLIASGISPIRGSGIKRRFAKYKNASIYPGDRKGSRPVNLELTGQQLRSLQPGKIKSTGFEIGYYNKKAEDKESGHREGVNGQAKRPTIPQGRERFAKSIELEQEEILVQDLLKQIRKL